jgi:hypothetical protein
MANAPTAQPDSMTCDIVMHYDKYNNGKDEEMANTPIVQPDVIMRYDKYNSELPLRNQTIRKVKLPCAMKNTTGDTN